MQSLWRRINRVVRHERLAFVAGTLTLSALSIATARDDGARMGAIFSFGLIAPLVSLIVYSGRARVGALATATIAGTLVAVVAFPSSDSAGYLAPLLLEHLPRTSAPPGIHVSGNALAYLVAPAVTSGLALALSSRKLRVSIVLGAFTIAGLALVLASGSRAAAFGVAAGIVVCLLLSTNGCRRAWIIGAAVWLSVLIFPDFNDRDLHTLELRFRIWNYALGLVGDPVVGLGFGGFARLRAEPTALVLNGQDRPYNVHSLFVQTFVDFGAVGAVLLAAMVWLSVAEAVRLRSLPGGERGARAVSLATIAGLAALLVTGFAESVLSTSFPIASQPITLVSPVPLLLLAAPVGLFRSIRRGTRAPSA